MVTGAGGFVGGHLVRSLLDSGHSVRAIDVKPIEDWCQAFPDAVSSSRDCASRDVAYEVTADVDHVYNLASDMGGMGFLENNKAACMLNVLINTHLLQAARDNRVSRFFFASSACVYAADRQSRSDVTALTESDVYPAMPEDGYGWEKLFGERLCRHFREDYGLATRVARYHNVYGPLGTFRGGREKAPAAICRKVAEAELLGTGEIEVWGDGNQTRSFMHVADCVRGSRAIAEGAYVDPLNLGSSETVSINELIDLVQGIAGVSLRRRYLLDAPQGVRGRSSDNTEFRRVHGWEPSTALRDGLCETYGWIRDQVRTAYGVPH